jgi:AraC-like DNA-binding protein
VFPFWVLQSYLVLPPAVWLFVQLNTNPLFEFNKKHMLLFIPACIDMLVKIFWTLWRRLSGEHLPSLIENKPWFLFTEILPIIGMLVVLYLYAYRLVSVSKELKAVSSPASPVVLIKLYGLFTFLFLLTALWIAGVVMELQIFTIMEFIITLFLFVLGYIGYFNPTFFDVPKFLKNKSAEVLTFPTYNDQKELMRLTKQFEQNALHTRSKLSLEELAGELKLPPRYVSYLINTYHGTNFNNFVNSYRVKEVMRKIHDPAEQHKTLLALALESGFNSKSTFNQVFKNHTGQSPSEYLLCKK